MAQRAGHVGPCGHVHEVWPLPCPGAVRFLGQDRHHRRVGWQDVVAFAGQKIHHRRGGDVGDDHQADVDPGQLLAQHGRQRGTAGGVAMPGDVEVLGVDVVDADALVFKGGHRVGDHGIRHRQARLYPRQDEHAPELLVLGRCIGLCCDLPGRRSAGAGQRRPAGKQHGGGQQGANEAYRLEPAGGAPVAVDAGVRPRASAPSGQRQPDGPHQPAGPVRRSAPEGGASGIGGVAIRR